VEAGKEEAGEKVVVRVDGIKSVVEGLRDGGGGGSEEEDDLDNDDRGAGGGENDRTFDRESGGAV